MKGARTVSGNTVSVDEGPLRADIGNLVRKTVEETLNAPLDEEAAWRGSGPQAQGATFQTAII